MSLVIWLVVMLGFQYFLYFILGLLGLQGIEIELVFDLVLAFVFAFINYPGRKSEALRDVRFHKNVAFCFVILVLFSFLFGAF